MLCDAGALELDPSVSRYRPEPSCIKECRGAELGAAGGIGKARSVALVLSVPANGNALNEDASTGRHGPGWRCPAGLRFGVGHSAAGKNGARLSASEHVRPAGRRVDGAGLSS